VATGQSGRYKGKGKYVKVTSWDRKTFRAYLATPPGRKGPGILLCQEIFGINDHIREVADQYAEEGFFVLAPDLFHRLEPNVELGYGEEDFKRAFGFYQRFDEDKGAKDIKSAVGALRKVKGCNGKVAALGYCLGGKLAYLAAARAGVDAAIGYYGVYIEKNLKEAGKIKCPLLLHFAGSDRFVPPAAEAKIRKALAKLPEFESYVYPGADHAFNCKERASYDKSASSLAYSRSIGFLRRHLGPQYDLSGLWDRHTAYEFATRDVDATMKTMVDNPYVNHIPTLTGGVGQKDLARFYRHHFIPRTPKDTRLVPISRTVGADRVVDEMLFCFTHDIEIDWMLPGVAPTGKYVEIPLVAIVNFRGPKICHEHIYWDQASVLVQLGLLDPATLPVAGVETARKLLDETQPSNLLMRKSWALSEGK
jgi:carboxymethylenebutenolidase